METCSTCKHWRREDQDKYNYLEITMGYRPGGGYDYVEDEQEAIKVWGYRVRRCTHPKLLFYERPESNAATVVDGSQYKAKLFTGEQFGCVLHELMEKF